MFCVSHRNVLCLYLQKVCQSCEIYECVFQVWLETTEQSVLHQSDLCSALILQFRPSEILCEGGGQTSFKSLCFILEQKHAFHFIYTVFITCFLPLPQKCFSLQIDVIKSCPQSKSSLKISFSNLFLNFCKFKKGTKTPLRLIFELEKGTENSKLG